MKNKNSVQNLSIFPAEFEKHRSTWIAWPHNKNDWPGKFIPIHWVYAEIVRVLSSSEKVNIIVQNSQHKAKVLSILNKSKSDLFNIEFHIFDTDRSWLRDTFPQFIRNTKTKKLDLVKFKFNAWAKYNNYKKDYKLPDYIARKLNMNITSAVFNNEEIVLEGGSIDHNGANTLITTEECLLDKNIQVRNQSMTKTNYEEAFKNYLGIDRVIWLKNGIAGDDTHGHIDDLCRFVNKNTILLVQEKNKSDINYKNLYENKIILNEFNENLNSKFNIDYLPMPSPVYFDKMRLPASYANFYIANEVVIVPTFNDENDYKALGILREHFPTKKIIGIHSVDLVWGLGTLHCLTHEEPEF